MGMSSRFETESSKKNVVFKTMLLSERTWASQEQHDQGTGCFSASRGGQVDPECGPRDT